MIKTKNHQILFEAKPLLQLSVLVQVPDTEALEHCKIQGREYYIIQAQLRWAGHTVHMEDMTFPKLLS